MHPETCGDGIVNGDEECDDANDNDTDACVECKLATCGDGYLRRRLEQCDDANLVSGDGCSALCQEEESPYCGDGHTDPGEDCDDGNSNNNDSCLNTCQDAVCGDGYIRDGQETCDDGNTESFDCCDGSCQNE